VIILNIQIKDLWDLADILPMQPSLQLQGLSSSWLGLKPSKEVVVACNVASQQKFTSSYVDINSATKPCITKQNGESVHGSANDGFILVNSLDKKNCVVNNITDSVSVSSKKSRTPMAGARKYFYAYSYH
jgi:hypothetical protein